MTHFEPLQETLDIKTLIKETFDTELSISGSWGYTPESATILLALPEGMPKEALQHMITSIRAHMEMNIMQEPENRYGAINANELSREEIKTDTGLFEKVTYTLTAMQEEIYNAFIKEYKEGYGKEGFDLNAHFKKREESTLTRKIVHYFEVSALQ